MMYMKVVFTVIVRKNVYIFSVLTENLIFKRRAYMQDL